MTVADDLLPRVKAALDMKSGDSDGELLDLLDSAADYYTEAVGPLPGTATVRLSGGGGIHLLPRNVTAITAGVYANGATVNLAALQLDPAAGVLYGPLTYGSRNVVLTVTVGPLPPRHAATIVEDVAEYWQRTQRAGGAARPSFGGDGFEEASSGRPLVMFPRIRALAGSSVA